MFAFETRIGISGGMKTVVFAECGLSEAVSIL
jgi:hypothetical protein